jgi:DNA-binding response OmpR family regulator
MADARPLSLLIVEDDAMVLRLLRAGAEAAGCVVAATASAVDEALSLIDAPSRVFDAALLDVNLRGVPSDPVAERLRARGVPYVVVTGYSAEHASVLAADAPVLRKPFRMKALAETLKRLSGSSTSQDSARA